MTERDEALVNKRLRQAGVELAIFGHNHTHKYYTRDDVRHLLVDDAGDLNYAAVTVTEETHTVSREWVNHDD